MKAQRTAVKHYLGENEPLAEFEEVESGKRTDRPELAKALDLCRDAGAVLIIAKIDRLSRNAAFLLSLKESGVEFIAADMPSANRLTVGIMALVAEDERERIASRTKAALAERKRDGVLLGTKAHRRVQEPGYVLDMVGVMVQARLKKAAGYRERIMPIVQEIRGTGIQTLQGIADCLNRRGYHAFRGGAFRAQNVAGLLQ